MFDPKTILAPVEIDVVNLGWLTTALQFVRRVEAEVHFFFVNDPQAGYRHPTVTAEQVAETIRENVDAKELEGLSLVFAVGKGDLAGEVKRYCEEQNVDMIISGHKHHSKLYTSFFDTKDEEILDAVTIPVLIIPK